MNDIQHWQEMDDSGSSMLSYSWSELSQLFWEQFGRTNQNILDTRISFLPLEVVIIMCLAEAVLCFLIRKRGASYISINKERYHNSWDIPFLWKNQGSLSKQK